MSLKGLVRLASRHLGKIAREVKYEAKKDWDALTTVPLADLRDPELLGRIMFRIRLGLRAYLNSFNAEEILKRHSFEHPSGRVIISITPIVRQPAKTVTEALAQAEVAQLEEKLRQDGEHLGEAERVKLSQQLDDLRQSLRDDPTPDKKPLSQVLRETLTEFSAGYADGVQGRDPAESLASVMKTSDARATVGRLLQKLKALRDQDMSSLTGDERGALEAGDALSEADRQLAELHAERALLLQPFPPERDSLSNQDIVHLLGGMFPQDAVQAYDPITDRVTLTKEQECERAARATRLVRVEAAIAAAEAERKQAEEKLRDLSERLDHKD
ncbi:hypothetical protein H696_04591 [Fonticula alba]|uniref:Uncharacterized protein n=1 Tax=Fonticula alba TaxID=691883 RepID=A0A058Z4G4_FONAL|nr:hypothetical protein H696_04591 [Fonticula alba]KCV69179.1 hypothetical protein H696_04591 [Fonticula alba]|eukprot:XP_009496750.1 hypothetical protein H696_04591 [Fonticula alba]